MLTSSLLRSFANVGPASSAHVERRGMVGQPSLPDSGSNFVSSPPQHENLSHARQSFGCRGQKNECDYRLNHALRALNDISSTVFKIVLPVMSLLLISTTLLSVLPTATGEPGVKNTHTVYGGGCPAACSGHGQCVGAKVDGLVDKPGHECKCHSGFTGVDCTLRICPSGRAWADSASAPQTAHRDGVECSGFGFCNRQFGTCKCRDGFEGNACQRLSCPKVSKVMVVIT